MIVRVSRSTMRQAATIGTATSSATAIRLEGAAGVAIFVGPLTASVSVSIFAGGSVDNPAALVDGGALQTVPLAASTSSASYALPDALFASRYLWLVASSELSCTVAAKS